MTKATPTLLTNSCKGKGSLRRPRTKAFLERVARYESVQRSCAFLEREVENLCSTNSEEASLTSSSSSSALSIPAHLQNFQTVGKSLHKHMNIYDQKFQIHRQELERAANSNIRLYESFDCLSRAVEDHGISTTTTNSHPSSSVSPLSKLNQGPETTASIMGMIASFAGVPSKEDLGDWQELSVCISNDQTASR